MRAFLAIAAAIVATQSFAQPSAKPWHVDAAYINVGCHWPWNLEADSWLMKLPLTAGFSTLFHNGAALSWRVRGCRFNGRNTPADYIPGSRVGAPMESMEIRTVSIGYKWQPTRRPHLRVGAEAGPAVVRYKRAHFTPQAVTTNFLFGGYSSNYSSHQVYERHTAFSTALRIELPIDRYVGAEVGVWKVFNPLLPLAGLEASLTLGIVRRRVDAPSEE